jgi:hypothetical protein
MIPRTIKSTANSSACSRILYPASPDSTNAFGSRHTFVSGAGLLSRPSYIMERGPPADAILRTAKKNTIADPIVLGVHGVEEHLTVALSYNSGAVQSDIQVVSN